MSRHAGNPRSRGGCGQGQMFETESVGSNIATHHSSAVNHRQVACWAAAVPDVTFLVLEERKRRRRNTSCTYDIDSPYHWTVCCRCLLFCCCCVRLPGLFVFAMRISHDESTTRRGIQPVLLRNFKIRPFAELERSMAHLESELCEALRSVDI